jgi:hypothetical protein
LEVQATGDSLAGVRIDDLAAQPHQLLIPSGAITGEGKPKEQAGCEVPMHVVLDPDQLMELRSRPEPTTQAISLLR